MKPVLVVSADDIAKAGVVVQQLMEVSRNKGAFVPVIQGKHVLKIMDRLAERTFWAYIPDEANYLEDDDWEEEDT